MGESEIIYLSLHCHHQNDSCIKMGSDESHFNVSLIVRDKVTRQCPQTTIFEEKGELKPIRTKVPMLTSLTPYRYAKSAHPGVCVCLFFLLYSQVRKGNLINMSMNSVLPMYHGSSCHTCT